MLLVVVFTLRGKKRRSVYSQNSIHRSRSEYRGKSKKPAATITMRNPNHICHAKPSPPVAVLGRAEQSITQRSLRETGPMGSEICREHGASCYVLPRSGTDSRESCGIWNLESECDGWVGVRRITRQILLVNVCMCVCVSVCVYAGCGSESIGSRSFVVAIHSFIHSFIHPFVR